MLGEQATQWGATLAVLVITLTYIGWVRRRGRRHEHERASATEHTPPTSTAGLSLRAFEVELPADVLERIAADLDTKSLARWAQSSRATRDSAASPAIWRAILRDELRFKVLTYEAQADPDLPPYPAHEASVHPQTLCRRAHGALCANARFYRAFQRCHFAHMRRMWVEDAMWAADASGRMEPWQISLSGRMGIGFPRTAVLCHPGPGGEQVGPYVGYDSVMDSWKDVLARPADTQQSNDSATMDSSAGRQKLGYNVSFVEQSSHVASGVHYHGPARFISPCGRHVRLTAAEVAWTGHGQVIKLPTLNMLALVPVAGGGFDQFGSGEADLEWRMAVREAGNEPDD